DRPAAGQDGGEVLPGLGPAGREQPDAVVGEPVRGLGPPGVGGCRGGLLGGVQQQEQGAAGVGAEPGGVLGGGGRDAEPGGGQGEGAAGGAGERGVVRREVGAA